MIAEKWYQQKTGDKAITWETFKDLMSSLPKERALNAWSVPELHQVRGKLIGLLAKGGYNIFEIPTKNLVEGKIVVTDVTAPSMIIKTQIKQGELLQQKKNSMLEPLDMSKPVDFSKPVAANQVEDEYARGITTAVM